MKKTAIEVLEEHMKEANGDLTVWQEEWIITAMEEYAEQQVKKCDLADVVGSTVNVDEKAHYEALKECCQKLLKTVDEGKVPQKEIIGLRILFGK